MLHAGHVRNVALQHRSSSACCLSAFLIMRPCCSHHSKEVAGAMAVPRPESHQMSERLTQYIVIFSIWKSFVIRICRWIPKRQRSKVKSHDMICGNAVYVHLCFMFNNGCLCWCLKHQSHWAFTLPAIKTSVTMPYCKCTDLCGIYLHFFCKLLCEAQVFPEAFALHF